MATRRTTRDGIVLVAVVGAAVALLCAPAAAASDCTWDSGMGATYDLSKLTTDTQYNVKDLFAGHDGHDFSYVFNVCANTGSIPGAGPDGTGDACQVTTGVGGETMRGVGPAFQVANWDNYCYRLGNTPEHVTWGLIEENNPAYGVAMTYTDGESCRGSDYKLFNRSLRLAFVCDDEEGNIPDEEPIEEIFKCTYEMYIRTAYGCPTECPVVNGHVCNKHGVCGYDTDSSKAACFCTTGWGGVGCATAVSTSGGGMSGEAVASVIVVILLVLVLVAVVYMFLKLRKLRVDPDSYKGLTGKFNELGTLAG